MTLPIPWLTADALFTALALLDSPPLDEIPQLPHVAYPKKLVSHDLDIDEILTRPGAMTDVIREVNERLLAEAARLRRLLPEPLPGHEWRAEINVEESMEGFRISSVARVRYRLVKVDSRP